MPKETVFGEQHTFDDDSPPRIPVIEVRWSRDQTVQVVTRAEDANGGRYVTSVDPDASLEPHFTDGFYVNLDRHAINDVIRKLRRARDQAFGRDE